MSVSPTSSDVSSSSGEEEEEEMTPPSKKPAVTAAASPPRKPSTTTAKSPSKSLSHIPSPQPSNPESSEEEDDSGAEESTDADSSSDDTAAAVAAAAVAAVAVAATEPSDSDDSGSDTESSNHPFEIRHSYHAPDPSIKPLASKPMAEPAQSRKPASHKKLLTDLKASPELPHSRQPLMWSKDDELVLLSGLADYTRKKGSVPTATDMDDFHVSTQKSLGIDVSKTQLSDKIRRLKKKYLDSASSSSKSVDQDVIKLCNQIWGRGGKSVKSENGKAEKYVEDEVTWKRQKTEDGHYSVDSIHEESSDHDNLLADQHSRTLLRELVLKTATKQTASAAGEAVEMVDGAKAEEIVGRHKKLALLEMKSNLRRTALMQESVKLFMEALEKLV